MSAPLEPLNECLRLALAEERGLLIVALYELPDKQLEELVNAAQLIDSEGCEILDTEAKIGHMDRPYGL